MIACPKCARTFKGTGIGSHATKCGVTAEMRFWIKVDKNAPGGCWIWKGAKNWAGYGLFGMYHELRRVVIAHRFAWESTNGPIPNGLFALHKCDVRACCNPSHLFLGTDADNHRDKSIKGRCHDTLLTHDQVREARRLFGTMTLKAIADRYGVDPGVISALKRGRTYRHIV